MIATLGRIISGNRHLRQMGKHLKARDLPSMHFAFRNFPKEKDVYTELSMGMLAWAMLECEAGEPDFPIVDEFRCLLDPGRTDRSIMTYADLLDAFAKGRKDQYFAVKQEFQSIAPYHVRNTLLVW